MIGLPTKWMLGRGGALGEQVWTVEGKKEVYEIGILVRSHKPLDRASRGILTLNASQSN